MAVLFLRGCCFKVLPCRDIGDQPVHIHLGQLLALALLETGIGWDKLLLSMKQITQLIEVMLVGRVVTGAVGQATLGIDTNVGLHAKVPLIAFSWSDASPDRVAALCSW